MGQLAPTSLLTAHASKRTHTILTRAPTASVVAPVLSLREKRCALDREIQTLARTDARTGERWHPLARSALIVAVNYFTAASSAAVHGVVRELFAARISATLAAVTGAALLPQAPRT